MDARFPRDELVRRIRKVSRFRSRISLRGEDTLGLLRQAQEDAQSFYFLDPPYYEKGERLYDNFYSHVDHIGVRDTVTALGCPWVVSYDVAPPILRMYNGFQSVRYSASYSANRRQDGAEVMFFAPGLLTPEENPAGVPEARVKEVRLETLVGLVP